MNISCLPLAQLTEQHLHAWRKILDDCPELQSGLFRPELFCMLASQRDGLEVAVIENDGETLGFLPFERCAGGKAYPALGQLADFQGGIFAAELPVDVTDILVACDLTSFHFNHLLACQESFIPYHSVTSESPYIDLSEGFEAYVAERKRAKSDELKEALRKGRKLGRDVGPVKLVPYEGQVEILDQLLDWKRQQLAHMNVPNGLEDAWVRSFFIDLMQVNEPEFAGMLSAVYVGDELLAATMGVRSQTTLHGWVTCYNPEFRKFSPGLVLITELGQASAELGITRIDMGKGPESFKRSFRSGAVQLAEGVAHTGQVANVMSGLMLRTKEWVKTTPLADPARQLANSWKTRLQS